MLSQGESGWTKLYLYATINLLGEARQLLDSAKELEVLSEIVDKTCDLGCTPLWAASKFGHHKIVELLLQYGANVDKAGNDGSTPLMTAAREGHLDVFNVLIENGADVREMGKWTMEVMR